MEHVTLDRGLISSLEDFALFLNLSGYISTKTSQRGLGINNWEIKDRATLLLHRRIKEDSRLGFAVATELKVDMVSALLRLGTDVNWKDREGLGTWDLYLDIICREGPVFSGRRLTYDEISDVFLQRVQIMTLFLSAGAELRAFLYYAGSQHSLDEFIREYIVRRYPAEAAEVLLEYEKAILREARKRRWNQADEYEEEDSQIKKQRRI
jgi:hypothetical protein